MALHVEAPKIETNDDANISEALELEHLIGMTCNYVNSFIIHPIETNKCIYSIGPTVVIGDLTDEHSQITLKSHDEPISCITVSSCGTMIASGQHGSSLDKNMATVSLWDYTNERLIHSFSGLKNKVHKVLFCPDSKFLIAIDTNGLFIVWDTKTFETIYAKQMVVDKKLINIDSVQILNEVLDEKQFGKNSKHNVYKIAVSYDCYLYEWTLMYSVKHMEYILADIVKYSYPPNRTFNRTLTHLAKISTNNHSDECKENDLFLIAAATNIGEIFLFDSNHKKYIDSFQVCSQGANVACFLNSDNLIIGGGDGSMKRFAFDSKRNKWNLLKSVQFESSVNTLTLTKDMNEIFVTTTQSNAYRVNLDDLCANNDVNVPYKLMFESSFSPIGKIVFGQKYNHIFATLTSVNGILTIWDLSNYLSIGTVAYKSNGTALTYYEEDKILTGFEDGSIILNHIDFVNNGRDTKMEWQIKSAHRGKVNCIEVCEVRDRKSSNTKILLLSGGDDGLLNVWNYNTKQLISQYHIMIESVMDIIKDCEFKETVHLLGSNGQIATFSLKREGIIIRRMIKDANNRNFGKLTCLVQSHHNEYELLAGTSNGWLLIWDQELSELIEAFDCKEIVHQTNHLQILSIAISQNGKYVCFGNHIGQIFIILMESKQLVACHEVHSGGVQSIAWTPDDKQIVTSSIDSSIAVSNFYT